MRPSGNFSPAITILVLVLIGSSLGQKIEEVISDGVKASDEFKDAKELRPEAPPEWVKGSPKSGSTKKSFYKGIWKNSAKKDPYLAKSSKKPRQSVFSKISESLRKVFDFLIGKRVVIYRSRSGPNDAPPWYSYFHVEKEWKELDKNPVVMSKELAAVTMEDLLSQLAATRTPGNEFENYLETLSEEWEYVKSYGMMKNPEKIASIRRSLENSLLELKGPVMKDSSGREVKVLLKQTEREIQMLRVKILWALGTHLGDSRARTVMKDVVKMLSERKEKDQPKLLRYLKVAQYLMPRVKSSEGFYAPKIQEDLAIAMTSPPPSKLRNRDNSDLLQLVEASLNLDKSIPEMTKASELEQYVTLQNDAIDAFKIVFSRACEGDLKAKEEIEHLKTDFPPFKRGELDYKPVENIKPNYLRQHIYEAPRMIELSHEIEPLQKARLADGDHLPIFTAVYGKAEDWFNFMRDSKDLKVQEIFQKMREEVKEGYIPSYVPSIEHAESVLTPEGSKGRSNHDIFDALLTLFNQAAISHTAALEVDNPAFMALLRAHDSWKSRKSYDLVVQTWIGETIEILQHSALFHKQSDRDTVKWFKRMKFKRPEKEPPLAPAE